jgi:ribose transport system permease protein
MSGVAKEMGMTDSSMDRAKTRLNTFRQFGERGALVFVWLLLIVVFVSLKPDTFATTSNLQVILGSQTTVVLLALALLPSLTTGDYDLSAASAMSMSAMIIAYFNVNQGWAIEQAIMVGVGAALLIGVVNGILVVGFGLESFIITLGMGTLLQGLILWISDSQTIAGVSDSLINAVIGAKLFSIPLSFYYGLALCVAIWYVFEYTSVGRKLLYVGRSRDVARLSGIRVRTIRFGALVTTSGIAGLAGVVYVGTLGAANPTSGASFLLPAFAAAFLGATAIIPGSFNPWGTFVAVYFLVTGITGLQLLGAPGFVQQLFYGGALIVAVTISGIVRKRTNN